MVETRCVDFAIRGITGETLQFVITDRGETRTVLLNPGCRLTIRDDIGIVLDVRYERAFFGLIGPWRVKVNNLAEVQEHSP